MADFTMTRGARWATAGLLFLTLVVGGGNLWATRDEVGAVQAANARSARATATVTQLCEAGNMARAQQVTLWEHLVAISVPPPHETPAATQKRLAVTKTFIAYVRRVFAPRNCQAPLRTAGGSR